MIKYLKAVHRRTQPKYNAESDRLIEDRDTTYAWELKNSQSWALKSKNS